MINDAELRRFAGHFATGVTVVTTRDSAGTYHGLTMNAVSCVSLAPPTFLICVDRNANSLQAILESGIFAINILASNQKEISNAFASKNTNKFRELGYELGVLQVPLITDALAFAEFRVTHTYPAADHVIVLGEAQSTGIGGSDPLLYYRGKYVYWSRLNENDLKEKQTTSHRDLHKSETH